MPAQHGPHGATVADDGASTTFRVWAPERRRVELVTFERTADGARETASLATTKGEDGFHELTVAGVGHGALYAYRLDGEGQFPDPASRAQPLGVHGPSAVVDPRRLRFAHDFPGRSLTETHAILEVHVGAATAEGTFAALARALEVLVPPGIDAIELMPLADFPGARGWGYDGVSLCAPARCYGTPEDLAALIDAAHARGLAVILDVVLNHLGPSGNYLAQFSKRYFTDRHRTPWGDAIDWEGPHAGPVRALALQCVRQWIADYRFDGIRLDATHAIFDDSSPSILAELGDAARDAAPDRKVIVIAEDGRNEARLATPQTRGGEGLDATWSDDFHHAVRRRLSGDDEGYFRDFTGATEELATIARRGWLYEGQPSPHFGGPRGSDATRLPAEAIVIALQNHDQIGNRARGERLHHEVPLARVRAATALLLALPYTPLLFMGEDFGASSPFPYFTDHEPELGRAVTEGRRREFASFRAFADETRRAEIPDPQAAETFLRAKLDLAEATRMPGAGLRALHVELLRLRRQSPAMKARDRAHVEVVTSGALLAVRRSAPAAGSASLLFIVALTEGGALALDGPLAPPEGRRWRLWLDTEEPRFGGEGAWGRVDPGRAVLTHAGALVLVS
jgi:maltooligosyltrehalose trehalohydrolase